MFEIYLIVGLVVLQIAVFLNVYIKISEFKGFFPSDFSLIKIKKLFIPEVVMNNPQMFDEFINSIAEDKDEIQINEASQEVELLIIPEQIKTDYYDFYQVIKSTNAYLCKNKGASADFNILQDICERQVNKSDNEIGNLINVPLYIGLGGTFVGIIIGLLGINFSPIESNSLATISPESISQLLNGVSAAMGASLMGLVFTVINSAIFYKPAAYINETNKNKYYDFIQRNLLPYLNDGVAGTLGTFRDVLNQFIKKFGENMDDYRVSGQLLNENLRTQHFVLEEINKLSITKTSSEIAKVFHQINESSKHLEIFYNYQTSLNQYLDKVDLVTDKMDRSIAQFTDFNSNLKAITSSTLASYDLQKQFKDSLEIHFPTINDHREKWGESVDLLNNDIAKVYHELEDYFKVSTNQIKGFVENNQQYFSSINEVDKVLKVFTASTEIDREKTNFLADELIKLRGEFQSSKEQEALRDKAILSAIEKLNEVLGKIGEQPLINE